MSTTRCARTLARTACQLLGARGQTLATAESCTGGLIAAAITSVPGSSAAFVGAVVAYANAVKLGLLDVPESLLKRHGAVSRQCVQAMAQGARRRLGADWSIAISGIAGPGGATPGKPVGTVWTAISGPRTAIAWCTVFSGSRTRVRTQAVEAALSALLSRLGVGVTRTTDRAR